MKTLILLLSALPCYAYTQTINIGPLGNGANDAPSIQYAVDNFKIVNCAFGTYWLGTEIHVLDGVVFNGNKSSFKPLVSLPVSTKFLFYTESGTTHTGTGLAITCTKGSKTFTYSGAANLTPGEIVFLQGPVYYTTYKHGWYATVVSSIGTTVTVNVAASENFTASAVYEYRTGKNIQFNEINLDLTGRLGGNGILLNNTRNSSVNWSTVTGTVDSTSIEQGIIVLGCDNLIYKCRASGFDTDVPGYAFAGDGHYNTFSYCNGYGARHSFTSARRDWYSTQINFLYDTASNAGGGTGTLYDWHANSYDSRVEGSVGIATSPNAIIVAIRAKRDTAKGNTFIFNQWGTADAGAFAFWENCNAPVIMNNRVTMNGTKGYIIRTFSGMIAPPQNIKLIGNFFKGGTVALSAAIGTGFLSSSNRYEDNGTLLVAINISTSSIPDWKSQGDVFIKKSGNTFNYSIVTTAVTSSGFILNDTLYIMSSDNLFPQLIIKNTLNTVQNNVIYTTTNNFLANKSGSNINILTPNTVINGLGTPAPYNPSTPVPTNPVEPPIEEPAPPPVDEPKSGKIRGKQKQVTT